MLVHAMEMQHVDNSMCMHKRRSLGRTSKKQEANGVSSKIQGLDGPLNIVGLREFAHLSGSLESSPVRAIQKQEETGDYWGFF